MFIGHFGIALGAKKLNPRLSLGTLFLVAQLLDLIWPLLLIAGLEHVKVDPAPDDPVVIGAVTMAMWLLVAWAYWVDSHRRSR